MAIQFNGQITPNKSTGTKEVFAGQHSGPLAPQNTTIVSTTPEPTTPGTYTGPLNPICIGPSPGPGYVCVPNLESVPGTHGEIKGKWEFQGTIPPPPPSDCRLSDYGLALGETPISLNGTIVDHFNSTFKPALMISQTDGLHRTEAARRLSESDPNNDWIFVNTGEKLEDKCFINDTDKQKIVIPNTNKIEFMSFYFPALGGHLYVGDDMSLYRLEMKGNMPEPPPGGNIGSGQIYTKIDSSDILKNQQENTTYGMWSKTNGNLKTFFTSSSQNTASRMYNLEVRDLVDSNCKSSVLFSIAYGNANGLGSYDLGGKDYYTPSKAVYGQYKGLCLESSQSFFDIDGTTVKSIFAINIKRNKMGDRMDEGNWELNLHHLSGSQFLAGGNTVSAHTGSNVKLGRAGAVLRLIDDSNINSGSVTSAGNVYSIISGSLEDGAYTPTTPVRYGLSYPALGVLILDTNKLDTNASFLTVTGSSVSGSNEKQLFLAMSGAALQTDASGDFKGFQARKINKQFITHYFVRVFNDCYNHTNNYTWVSGSDGDIHPNFRYSDGIPITFITEVGLYNERKELLAVAKTSKAIKKTWTDEALFKIKLKYQ